MTTSQPGGLFQLLRPVDWVKNAFVLAPLVFAGKVLEAEAWVLAVQAFAGFCLLSSAVYIVNDIADVEEDRRHPTKRLRPIAAGQVSKAQAGWVAGFCLLTGSVVCLSASLAVLALGVCYVVLNLLYTVRLKGWLIVDVLCIALGFVLRALAGAAALGVPASRWLVACTFTLCMFLGFGKRRCELAQLGGGERAAAHRNTLAGYTAPLLDQFLGISAAAAIVSYILYTIDPGTLAKLGTPYLFFSAPLMIYCVLRMALLVQSGKVSGPTEVVTRDRDFIVAMILWVAYAVLIATWGRDLRAWLGGGGGPTLGG